MSNNEESRRNFLKKLGLGTLAMGAGLGETKILGKSSDGYIVENKEEYGEFPVEKLTNGDLPYKVNPDLLKNMEQRMNIFARNGWDPKRKEEMQKALELQGGKSIFEINLIDGEGKTPNQSRLDYAFMQAAWATSYMHPVYEWETKSFAIQQLSEFGKWNPEDIGMNWNEASIAVKHAAMFYGASLSGIAKLNPLWIYDEYKPGGSGDNSFETEQKTESKTVPESCNKVIALAFEEDYDGIMNSPGRLASAATGDGYSRMAITAFKVSEFIRALGYQAIPAGNGVGLSIPVAIDAGLGELGRNGILITPKYGPRVRLAKVYTDMPLIPDSPIRFGVKEFCDVCKLCAEDCPSGSISTEDQTWEGKSVSNNKGTLKWYVHAETCFDFNGFSCSNCKRNCPFNKPNNSWLHKLIRDNIKLKIKPLDSLMVTFDQASGYGKQSPAEEFWKKDGSASITARDPEV